ncbi:MAG TPA: hypothetical protein ENF17_07625 [Candidatus Aminicenantes bacterium]|nr:hypothetical protein [Candidatus Aminicenantes bacterium]
MVTRSDYKKDEVEICLSVMVELMTLLGPYRDHLVLVGGWVPYFLFPEKKQEHTGSLDIDIALDFRNISDNAYRTILQLLQERQYQQGKQPFIFYRTIERKPGVTVTVEIDLLAGEYGGTGRTHRTQQIQDVRARKARGCDLVFQNNVSIKLHERMPDGAQNEVTIKIANVVPFLVMKGMAIWESYKEKHAYDIYFTIRNYPGGISRLVRAFKPFISNKIVREGLAKIRAKFQDINAVGPVWVANFMEIDDEEEKEQIKRDAFEYVKALLDALAIEAFQEES